MSIALHDLVNLGHAPGMKPKPRAPYEADCVPVAVVVAVYRDGESEPVLVPVESVSVEGGKVVLRVIIPGETT